MQRAKEIDDWFTTGYEDLMARHAPMALSQE
jgi:hypothetical protein